MERLFNLDAQLVQDVVINGIAVLVLFAALSYLLFEPVRKILDERKAKIKEDKENASQEKADAMDLRIQYETKLKEIDKEAEGILGAARKKALQNEAQIIEEAKEEAKRVMDRASMEIELEKKRALDDMKKEIISVATVMAGKVVEASIDVKVQDQLIDETLKEMGEHTWLS